VLGVLVGSEVRARFGMVAGVWLWCPGQGFSHLRFLADSPTCKDVLLLYRSRSSSDASSLVYTSNGCAWYCTFGCFRSSRFLTSLTSAALVFHRCILISPFSAFSDVPIGPCIAFNTSSLAFFVFSSTACVLASTFSAAFASGKSAASTSSGESQDVVLFSLASVTASRKRTTVRAANMSPVPLKKQSIAGTSILKRRGEPSARAVEPTTERVGEAASKLTDVTTMCGMWWVLCSLVMASRRVGNDAILTSERSLEAGYGQ